MPLSTILLLAVVQGVTEFLPISSSGHLVIAAALLGSETSDWDVLDVNITLHAGTLLSILVYYWRRIWRLLGEDRRTIGLLIAATVPGVVVGVVIEEHFAGVLESPLVAGCMLPLTGLALLATTRLPLHTGRYQEMSYGKSLAVGASQALAILPGISRSGATICTGMSMGLAPEAAATFSFLMAIPIIAGGALWKMKDMAAGGLSTPWEHLALGAAVAFLVGLGAIVWLIRWIERGRLHLFAWWCIPVGLAVLVWQLPRALS